jgi:xylan 1,4-beta-xylosidase
LFEDATGKWWMVFHGYENGYYNMGRQTLLQPVGWTKDGWYKTPDDSKTDEPIKRPAGTTPATAFSLSDNFKDNVLHPQWAFFGEFDSNRFHKDDSGLILKGKGHSVGGSSPLTCVPSNHSYIAQVELFIDGEATGGLVLFYNDHYYSGILADKENILTNLRDWQFTTEKNVSNRHVFLRLRNTRNTVDMYYSNNGNTWHKIENSIEVSSFNHNVLSGFLSLRIGLCSIGEGTVRFRNFIYKPI